MRSCKFDKMNFSICHCFPFTVLFSANPDEELLPSDQYESLWTDFLASLQRENDRVGDEQPKSIVTTATEEDDNDDPEFRLPDNDYDVDDDLDEELRVSSKRTFLFKLN